MLQVLKRNFIFSFLVILLLSGCFESTLYIAGDSQAVGADIYIDGQKVGVMAKHVYAGSTSKNPVVIEREKKEQQRLGIKPGDIASGSEIRIPSGKHEIMVVNKEGKRLKKEFMVEGENYINVDFSKMVIEGGE